MFIDRREGTQQLFIDKDRLRRQARANGMCTRCVVRPAPRSRAYCQRCTDYAKQYTRKRSERRKTADMGGYDRYGEKVMRIADYGLARDFDRLPQTLAIRPESTSTLFAGQFPEFTSRVHERNVTRAHDSRDVAHHHACDAFDRLRGLVVDPGDDRDIRGG